jgi:hypothetical protein
VVVVEVEVEVEVVVGRQRFFRPRAEKRRAWRPRFSAPHPLQYFVSSPYVSSPYVYVRVGVDVGGTL